MKIISSKPDPINRTIGTIKRVELKDSFLRCRAVSVESGTIKIFNKNECDFSYRSSIFKKDLKNKYIIFDGSHNLSGADKLNKYLMETKIRPNVIFGMLKNKNAFQFLSILKKNIDTLYPVKIPDEKNTYTQKEIHKISKEIRLNTVIIKNLSYLVIIFLKIII